MATANVVNEFLLNVNVSESYKRQCSVARAELSSIECKDGSWYTNRCLTIDCLFTTGLMFYHGFFFFFFFFASQSPRSLNGTQPQPAICSEVSGFENACPKSGVFHPLQSWDPKTTFLRRLHNLTAILTAYIFRMKHDIHNQACASSALITTTRGLLHHLKMS